jgi:hypothetical protein
MVLDEIHTFHPKIMILSNTSKHVALRFEAFIPNAKHVFVCNVKCELSNVDIPKDYTIVELLCFVNRL